MTKRPKTQLSPAEELIELRKQNLRLSTLLGFTVREAKVQAHLFEVSFPETGEVIITVCSPSKSKKSETVFAEMAGGLIAAAIGAKPISPVIDPLEHGTMTSEILRAMEEIAHAAIELRNSGYDGDFVGAATEPLFAGVAALEQANMKARKVAAP